SLQRMFVQAQRLGALPTDLTFMQWATQAGILSNKLFDSTGHFVGLTDAISILGKTVDGMNPEQKAQALQALFTVRGDKPALQLLSHHQLTPDRLAKLDAVRKQTSAEEDATKVTNTFAGALKELRSTWHTVLAVIGSADLGPLTALFHGVNDGLRTFLN